MWRRWQGKGGAAGFGKERVKTGQGVHKVMAELEGMRSLRLGGKINEDKSLLPDGKAELGFTRDRWATEGPWWGKGWTWVKFDGQLLFFFLTRKKACAVRNTVQKP